MRSWLSLLLLPSSLAVACAAAPPAPAASSPAPATASETAKAEAKEKGKATATAGQGDAMLRYSIRHNGRRSGQAVAVRHADGSYDEDYEYQDRGRGPKLHTRFEVAPDGIVVRLLVTGKDYLHEEVREEASCDADRCRWKSKGEAGTGPRGLYVPLNGFMTWTSILLRTARHADSGTVRLLPAGSARVERVAETTVRRGDESKHVVAWQVAGIGMTPTIGWFDDEGAAFATVGDWGETVREGWEDTAPTLLALQKPLHQKRREQIARSIGCTPQKGLAIVNARLFDPARRRAIEGATILIEGKRVSRLGRKLAVPPSYEVIDAAGKTVLPGLWDMHTHLSDETGLLNLAHGITTARDMGNKMEPSLRRRARWDAGTELGPRVLLSGFIDGRGPYQGPTGALADTEAEARAAVDTFAENGYVQIKVYSSIKPELVPAIVEQAHKRRLRVSGHVPAKMIAEDAVKAGFDELHHVNFLMLNLIGDRDTDTRTPVRFKLVAEKAAELDLDAPRTRAFIDLLVARRTVVDPTLSVFEDMFTIRPDRPSRVMTPVLSRLPPQLQRGANRGGLPVPEGKDERFQESFRRCVQLVKRLWDRGVPLVAGTDNFAGLSLHRELELYAEAGIPHADVLAMATLGAARVMKRDAHSGSLAPGKDADLIVVDGNPLTNISDIRNVVTVVKDGTVIDARAAMASLSITPR